MALIWIVYEYVVAMLVTVMLLVLCVQQFVVANKYAYPQPHSSVREQI